MHSILDFQGPMKNDKGQITQACWEHAMARAGSSNSHAKALCKILIGWQSYAKAHKERYESEIGEDGVLGVYWAEIGLAIKKLLDGDTGGLDCVSISANIDNLIEAQGFKIDGCSIEEQAI